MKKQGNVDETKLRDAALLLLNQALAPSATVRRVAGLPFAIQLRGGETIPFELAAWHEGESRDRGENVVWILPRGPRALRERLRQRGDSYVEMGGAVHLSLPNLLVDRAGVTLPRAARIETAVDPFSDRSSLVLRTLFAGGAGRTWGLRELAAAAAVSPPTVTRTVRALARRGVLETDRRGRALNVRLCDPRALFDLWTRAYDWTRNHSLAVHAPMGDPIRFLRRERAAFGSGRFALSLQAGAALVAPLAAWDRAHVYVDVRRSEELVELAAQQGWQAAEDGRLVLMKPYYRDAIWHGLRNVDGLPVVSSLQLALDLWHYPLRGREQAEHLLEAGGVWG